MHEVMEAHEAPGSHEDSRLTLPVTVTLAILAVMLAMATLLGHRASTEEIILQTKATDQWALFQAKNIRLHEMQGFADLLGALSPVDKEKTEALRQKYLKETDRYVQEKGEVSEQAKELEKERESSGRRADRYEAGEAILQIALIICSLTLLTKKRIFWLFGIALGLIGLGTTLSGFLIH
jgi:hypothetical protein